MAAMAVRGTIGVQERRLWWGRLCAKIGRGLKQRERPQEYRSHGSVGLALLNHALPELMPSFLGSFPYTPPFALQLMVKLVGESIYWHSHTLRAFFAASPGGSGSHAMHHVLVPSGVVGSPDVTCGFLMMLVSDGGLTLPLWPWSWTVASLTYGGKRWVFGGLPTPIWEEAAIACPGLLVAASLSGHDTHVQGRIFTWKKYLHGHLICEKLVRVIFREDGLRLFPNYYVTNGPFTCSDYSYVFLNTDPAHPPRNKLKKIKLELKTWSKSTFGNFKHKLQCNADKLLQIEQKLALQPHSARLNNWHYRLIKQREKMHLFNENYWGKLPRKEWLVNGDRNSRYFHRVMKARKSRSSIVKIKDSSGVWIENAATIKQLFVNDF
ncbi:hypothetical protein Cgig2_023881 [Carnegiea gigantea]|uniref:Uncharacterized protein n=1 Tax=Carnegiea gigantea TaxID=171969 RepID=A0A9Q1JKA3_9CARY|nr:hypothetical protein Cgig2_023881 [Carnegiea gigantea]